MREIIFVAMATAMLAGCGWEAVHQATPVANVCKGLDQAACEVKSADCHWKAADAKCGQGAK